MENGTKIDLIQLSDVASYMIGSTLQNCTSADLTFLLLILDDGEPAQLNGNVPQEKVVESLQKFIDKINSTPEAS